MNRPHKRWMCLIEFNRNYTDDAFMQAGRGNVLLGADDGWLSAGTLDHTVGIQSRWPWYRCTRGVTLLLLLLYYYLVTSWWTACHLSYYVDLCMITLIVQVCQSHWWNITTQPQDLLTSGGPSLLLRFIIHSCHHTVLHIRDFNNYDYKSLLVNTPRPVLKG